MRKTIVAGLLVTAALSSAGVAHADTTGGGSKQFLEIIHAHVWDMTSTGGDSDYVRIGQLVCTQLELNSGSRASTQQQLANKWDNETDAQWFITASAVAFCPDMILSSDRW